MGKDFIFKRRINGVIETLYPKTSTTNVFKTYGNGSKKSLDNIIDDKGRASKYIEPSILEADTNDLILEMLGDVLSDEISSNISGIMVSDTAPTDTTYIWVDTSNESLSIMKFFNQNKSKWEYVDINRDKHSHIGMVVQSTTLDTMEKVIEIYGGSEWVLIEGQFLLGASSTYAVNSTGGESEHTLTVSEMPSHAHQQYIIGNSGSSGIRQDLAYIHSDVQKWIYEQCQSGATGGNTAHNNMPPYRAVYIWERVK